MTKPMFWIYGNRRQCIQAWDRVINLLGGIDNVNVQSVECGFIANADCKFATASDISILLRQKDLFDSRPRVVKVIGLPEDYAKLIGFLKYVNDSNVLVIYGAPGYRNAVNRWMPVNNSKFFKKIKEDGKVFDFPLEASSFESAKKWCLDIALEHKKVFEPEAVSNLINLSGRNFDLLESETVKLCDYQLGKNISVDDVVACCYMSHLDEVWSLLDYLDNRDYENAIIYMQKFYSQSALKGETFYGRVNQIFGAIEQHYLFVLLTYLSCGSNINLQKLQDDIGSIKKFGSSKKLIELTNGTIKPEEIGDYFSPQYIKMNLSKPSLRTALKWPEKKLYLTYLALKECKLACRIRSGDDASIRLFIDSFVSSVCDKFSYGCSLSMFKSVTEEQIWRKK